MGPAECTEQDTHIVGIPSVSPVPHALRLSHALWPRGQGRTSDWFMILNKVGWCVGQIKGDQVSSCAATGSPYSRETIRRQPSQCYTPSSVRDLFPSQGLLRGVSQLGIEVSQEICFPFLLFSNTGAKYARLCWAICLWEFCSIEDSEVVLWFGWWVRREPTNIQKLFKNMCDLVCTIWPVQQEPYVNHLKKTGLEHGLFSFHSILAYDRPKVEQWPVICFFYPHLFVGGFFFCHWNW